MRSDGKLARVLHVLVHMDLLGGKETSERIAQMLNTNPVVVRRMLGLLRENGIVESEGGRGGGWRISKSLDQITVLDVQRALHKGLVLDAPVSSDHPSCPVERASNTALVSAYALAEQTLVEALGAVTLAEIARGALADGVDA